METTRHAVRAAVLGSIAEIINEPVTSIGDSDHLVNDLGVDSMSAAHLLVAIEQRLDFSVPEGCESQLIAVTHVGQLVDAVTRLVASETD